MEILDYINQTESCFPEVLYICFVKNKENKNMEAEYIQLKKQQAINFCKIIGFVEISNQGGIKNIFRNQLILMKKVFTIYQN